MSHLIDPKAPACGGSAHGPDLTAHAARLSPWLVLRAILHIIKYSAMLSYGARP